MYNNTWKILHSGAIDQLKEGFKKVVRPPRTIGVTKQIIVRPQLLRTGRISTKAT